MSMVSSSKDHPFSMYVEEAGRYSVVIQSNVPSGEYADEFLEYAKNNAKVVESDSSALDERAQLFAKGILGALPENVQAKVHVSYMGEGGSWGMYTQETAPKEVKVVPPPPKQTGVINAEAHLAQE